MASDDAQLHKCSLTITKPRIALAAARGGVAPNVEDFGGHQCIRLVPALPGGPGTGAVALLDLFATPHNKRITWDHMLRQVSDWEGTLWGKPDWADRPTGDPSQWRTRERIAPGTAYEYNDVRVNALALATLQVWRRPLPSVLRADR